MKLSSVSLPNLLIVSILVLWALSAIWLVSLSTGSISVDLGAGSIGLTFPTRNDALPRQVGWVVEPLSAESVQDHYGLFLPGVYSDTSSGYKSVDVPLWCVLLLIILAVGLHWLRNRSPATSWVPVYHRAYLSFASGIGGTAIVYVVRSNAPSPASIAISCVVVVLLAVLIVLLNRPAYSYRRVMISTWLMGLGIAHVSFVVMLFHQGSTPPPTYSTIPALMLSGAISGLVLAIPALLATYRSRRQFRIGHGHCVTCGYNLTGNVSGICPECGQRIRSGMDRPSEVKRTSI